MNSTANASLETSASTGAVSGTNSTAEKTANWRFVLCREAAPYGLILLDSLPGSSLPTRAAAPSKVLVRDGALHNPDDPENVHNLTCAT